MSGEKDGSGLFQSPGSCPAEHELEASEAVMVGLGVGLRR